MLFRSLGVSAVGMAGGKAATRRIVAMSDMGGRTVDHLFFRTGIPTKLRVEDVADSLHAAADHLYDDIAQQTPPGLLWRLRRRVDRAVMSRLMFKRNPELYANVIRSWQERGWMTR